MTGQTQAVPMAAVSLTLLSSAIACYVLIKLMLMLFSQ